MSSLSTNLYGASINKGMGGLMSGLDTDDLVKQMTAATRNKINRQYQSKQKLLYRQEAYREISTKLLSFSNKYFSYSSGSVNNILSPKFFESYTFKSSSNYVNVTGDAENIKNFAIKEISQVATEASFVSKKSVTSGEFLSSDITQYTSSLAGETFSLDYNGTIHSFTISKDFGKEFTVDGNEEGILEKVVAELNKQIATMKDKDGILINEGNNNIEFELVEKEDGFIIGLNSDKETAKLSSASTDFLKVLDMKVGQVPTSQNSLKTADLTRTAKDVMIEGSITFEFNGVVKTIQLSHMETVKDDGTYYTYDAEGLSDFLQDKLDKEFGTGKIIVDRTNSKVTFKAENDSDIFGVSSISKELSHFTGIESGDYNRVNRNKSIKDLGLIGLEANDTYQFNINGAKIDIESTMSVTDIINKINSNAEAKVRVYYSSTTNTFTVKATETGEHLNISIIDVEGNLAETLFGAENVDYHINKGTDTKMTYTLNGVENTVTRSTANFTIDGINIELNEKASTIDYTTSDVTFDVTNNSDEVVERVKQFIDDYNEIISLIGTKASEKPNRNYLPLTPEQQDDMKEEEIKNWTEEAKKGILYGDSKINNVLRTMRSAMSGFTDVSSLTLSSLGISSANMDTSGKLIVDEKKLKEKLLENPDEISNLFTLTSSNTGNSAKSGIAIQLQQILRANIGNYGTTGILIEEAGMANSMTSDSNYISKKIEEHDDKMAQLKKSLERERQRYWNQFSALEQSLNKLNAQSSWLTDMMGGN